jgi:hypothetical protein
MTPLGQLAQSPQAQTVPVLPFSIGTSNAGLLGNVSAQLVRSSPTDVDNVIGAYHRILNGAQPSFRLGLLKRKTFARGTQQARIEKSLAAVNAPQPTTLTLEQWKAILEEVEDED